MEHEFKLAAYSLPELAPLRPKRADVAGGITSSSTIIFNVRQPRIVARLFATSFRGSGKESAFRFLVKSFRLRSIITHFPYRDDATDGKLSISDFYDIVLELTRPGQYREDVRLAALNLIVLQVKTGHLRHLTEAMCRLAPDQLCWLLQRLGRPISTSYAVFDVQNSDGLQSIGQESLLFLMSRIVQRNKAESICQAVLNAHFDEILEAIGFRSHSIQELDSIFQAIFLYIARPSIDPYYRQQVVRILLHSMTQLLQGSAIQVLSHWDARRLEIAMKNMTLHFRQACPRLCRTNLVSDPASASSVVYMQSELCVFTLFRHFIIRVHLYH